MYSVATLDGGLQLAEVKVAGDGTRKLVLEITSGPGTYARTRVHIHGEFLGLAVFVYRSGSLARTCTRMHT